MHHCHKFAFGWLTAFGVGLLPGLVFALEPVVINEIHYNPDVKTERVEFIELYNAGTNTVNLAGWSFSDGVNFTFPATNIAPASYLVVAQDPAALAVKFPGTLSVGPINPDRSSALSKYGEKITLRNAAGQVVDEVDYQLGFPWPTVGDPPGYSIELINPKLDNNLAGSWRASVSGGSTPQSQELIAKNSTWKYFKGTNEASTPTTAWRNLAFNDSLWLSGAGPIGYGEPGFVATELADMQNNYVSVFFRKTFVVTNPATVTTLLLEASYDDGIKVWINGVNVVNANIASTEVPYNGTANSALENLAYVQFPLNNPASFLVPGTNVIAIQAHNSNISSSSDFWLDVRLSTETGPATRGPTPGRLNTVYAGNAPPQIRQVDHNPQQPHSGEAVRVTAKVTDPDGVGSVVLQYQLVNPGSYIELTDAAYTSNWTSVPMNDVGNDGDALAGDDVYTATLPPALQLHRRLVRYRITVTDTLGASVRVPYADDPQPNFAYFVYNAVPEWRAAVRPGTTPILTFSNTVMGRLPVYHLIGKSNTIATATWFSRYGGDLYQWAGTLVYDGKVYDHIHYRARGGVWRYSMVKNMWKFDLNRGHDFEARDNWGKRYQTSWTKLNLGACIQQGNFWHRGEQGMFESVGLRMFQLAGVTAPHTTFVTFRVIDDANEADPATQYEGDFWGLYLAVEQENGRFLEEHDLPDSNFYKMEGGTGELNNLGPNGPADKSDLNFILQNYTGKPETWWRTNWNLAKYYSYQAVVQAIHHYDICYDKNFFYYFHPATRLWQVTPWDLDLTWADNMYDAGCGGKDRLYQRLIDETNPAKPNILIEYRNRVREFRDLFFNNDQAYRLIDEYAALLRGPTNLLGTGPTSTILDADRSMWDYNPKMVNSAYTPNLEKAQQGYFYQWSQEPSVSKDFNGCIQLMKNYVVTRGAFLDNIATDALKPARPAAPTYTGPNGYPINRLTFRASTYSGANPFGSMKWRLGEVSTNSVGWSGSQPVWDNTESMKYEIEAQWELINNTYQADVTVPASVVRVGSRYRVRVQFMDNTGRTSNWSPPHEFTCGESENIADLLNYLRITEIMFNPPPAGYEYIELHNSSPTTTLDLSGVRFTQGVTYTFDPGVTMPPGGYLLVVGTTNIAGFRAYYGLDGSVPIVGPYDGGLANGGEQLTLRTAAGGTDIVSFDYRDGRGWPVAADEGGHSMVLLDSAESLQRSTSGDSGTGEYGGNWRASTYLRGSPGRADMPLAASIVLNEITAHTDYTNELTSNDWIELYNTTASPITLGPGWYLSDDTADLRKWQIPSNTIIAAHGWVSFDEMTGFHNPTNIGFGLSKDGEQVFLSYLPGTAEDRIVDAVSFKAQENDWSLGRYPDGGPFWYALTPRTRDAANAPPAAQVVISEVMYHPPPIGGTNDDALSEFIELYNSTPNPVPLFNTNGSWRIDGVAGDGNFDLPTGLALPAGGYLLVVNFDPTNTVLLSAFRAKYSLTDSNPPIVGPYSGKLANNSGRVALEKPQASDPPGSGVAWEIVDEVIYSDLPPWPCDTDATGSSLQRVSVLNHGCDPANWSGQWPTPGGPRAPEPPGVPDITVQPLSRVVATNSTVAFSVGVCGTPPFSYQWRFNGTNLLEATNATLLLNNLTFAHAGAYTVVVSNPAGSVESQPAILIVQEPPLVLVPPQPTTVVRGLTASFTVVPGGTPPFTYQWLFQNTTLQNAVATNSTLLLTNVQATQAGHYSVTVFNSAGSLTSPSALLTVLIPATITNQPLSWSVPPGTNVTFQVGATGTGGLTYQWRFNGLPIPDATNATLTLTNVQLEHSGTYTVVVTDTIGSDTSESATLTVRVRPGIVQQPTPTNLTVAVGGTASFNIVAAGTLPMGFRWMQSDSIYRTNIVPAGGTCWFTIPNAQLSDQGNYKVAITNSVGSATNGWSAKAYLTVLTPPSITLQPTNQAADPVSNVVFHAAAAGSAPLNYQWWFKSVLSNQWSVVSDATNASLTLSNVQTAQHGDYTFVASNPVGSATSQVARLTVLIPPLILVQPTNQTVIAGMDALLRVTAIGADPLTYQWKLSGTNLPGATRISLLLPGVQPADAGAYTVEVSNPLGTMLSDTATLTVLIADTDGDGIPDAWESANGLDGNDPRDAQMDTDRDGMTNWQEYLAGTNPTNRLSYLKIDTITATHGATVELTFLAVSNRTYTVLSRDALETSNWTRLAEFPTAQPTNRVVTVIHPLGNDPRRYYRLVTPLLPP